MRPRVICGVLVLAVLAGCAGSPSSGARGRGIDQFPMYGGLDRSANPTLKAADERFISDVTQAFGSREAASDRWVEEGIRFYYQDNYAMAMKRFNQAWLLNPDNPDGFWGFAVVYHDEGRNCEAKGMIDEALKRRLSKPIALADAGRIYTLCAAGDTSLDEAARSQIYADSEALYEKANELAPNSDYIHGSWATAYYWRGEYDRAAEMAVKARNLGFIFPGAFVNLLSEKLKAQQSP